MSLNVVLGLNAETLQAVNGLAEAIRSLSGLVGSVNSGVSTSSANPANTAPTGEPVYWRDPKTEEFGTCDEVEYKMLKKANSNLMKIPQAKYDGLVAAKAAAGEEQPEEEEPEESPAQKKARLKKEADKKKADDAAAQKLADQKAAAAKKAGADDEDAPSEQDIIDAFGGFLSSDLDKAERNVRATWVRPLLARFGVARATDIAEDDRKLALNLLQRKIAGQEVDAENDEYEEFEADEPSLV